MDVTMKDTLRDLALAVRDQGKRLNSSLALHCKNIIGTTTRKDYLEHEASKYGPGELGIIEADYDDVARYANNAN